jgi:pantothenate synthetase
MTDDETGKAVKDAADALDKKIVAAEEPLHQMRQTGRGQDLLRYPGKLIDHLMFLASGVSVADFAPTASQLEAHEELKKETATRKAEMNEVLAKEVAAFNRLLLDRGVPHVVGAAPTPTSDAK